MTHPPPQEEARVTLAAAAPEAPAQRQLLEQLLAQGLAPPDDSDDSTLSPEDTARYRKLLTVLFDACILKPLATTPDTTQGGVAREQAHLTLSILARQTSARPELLSSVPPDGEEPKRPLYAWLLTRIILAVTQYEELAGAETLVHELCEAAIALLTLLGRDLSDGESSYMRGPQRVASVLRQLLIWAKDSPSDKTALLGYDDLPSGPDYLPQLFVLHFILQTPIPTETHVAATITLGDLRKRIASLSPLRQSRYASIVAAAIPIASLQHVLSRACVAAAEFPESEDKRWQSSIEQLVGTVERNGQEWVQRDLWVSIQRQAEVMNVTTPASRKKAHYYLGPRDPWLSIEMIFKGIDQQVWDRWREQATATGPNGTELRDRLRHFIPMPETTTQKRKRVESTVEQSVRALLRSKVPELKIEDDMLESLPPALAGLGPAVAFKVLETTPTLACALSQCGDKHSPLPPDVAQTWLGGWDHVKDERTLMRALGVLFHHTSEEILGSAIWAKPIWLAVRALQSSDRRTRQAAAHIVSGVYRVLSVSADRNSQLRAQWDVLSKVAQLLKPKVGYPVQETALLLMGDFGCNASERDLGEVLEILLKQLGSTSSPLRSLAYTQLVDIASRRHKQPYNLLSPYLDRISVLLAECLVPQPEVVAETMQFIGYNRQAFFNLEVARKAVFPTLVVRQNRAALEMLATIFGQRLGLILIDEGASILAKIFLSPLRTSKALDFVGSLLNELTNTTSSTTLDKYIRASIVPLVVTIVVELGDEDPQVQQAASNALDAVQRAEHAAGADSGDLGAFLKPHMLGVLAAMTEQLMTPRTAVDSRRKIIRSIGKLISLVGDSMASFSPQIIASLQSTLDERDLRLQTLDTWYRFVDLLKFADVGPFIGPTIAAIVAQWSVFDAEERHAAKAIIHLISGNAAYLQAFRDDIVRFDHIKELAPMCQTLLKYREAWSVKEYLDKLVARTDSKNLAISTASMRELRNFLQDKHTDILQLVQGDTFDPIVGRVVRSLLAAVTRDGDCDDLRDLSYECFGTLGALDPDRFVANPEETSMTIMSNFTAHEESMNFALHLVRDLLVGAFRSTNDTKHQKNLAFAIQELLKFCGFDSRLVNRSGTVAIKVRQRWENLPKDVLETITPLLDAQFKQNQVKTTAFEYPIYPYMNTYREWVQAWTVDLIGRVMDSHNEGDAQAIFGVFNSEPKNQDVAVAHHLLPHLVLHVLLSGTAVARDQIKLEIHDVLRDQVSPTPGSAADKRMLSAQVIFDLMDHLSKWLRLARSDGDRQSHTRPVEQLLSSIDTELAANAALKSRAFARSLRNFEERVVYLRTTEKRGNAELQTYFESLHEIYAELDEPDGMEGVSAFVVSPSLELQIREHESTGRWTSAQSCWEVRLQQQPEDIKLHVGLLKCLKNLGHYDTLRTHITGVLSRHPQWAEELAPFQAEAAWTIGDWATVEQVQNPPAIANVFLAIQSEGNVQEALKMARRKVGSEISTREYSRAYEAILQLHHIREVEMIHAADTAAWSMKAGVSKVNAAAIARRHSDALVANLSERFLTTLPSFRAREEILSKRRTAFTLVNTPRLRPELGQAWIQSAKIARKSGYEQTAYSAALQATEAEAPFAFIQQAKLIRMHGGILKALRELEHPIARLIRATEDTSSSDVIDLTCTSSDGLRTEDDFRRDRSLAKAVLLEARWSHEADRFEQNDVIRRFKRATELGPTLESPFFHLGRYYDTLAATTTNIEEIAAYNHFTCLNYHEALQRGVKYIYQTIPRLLTVWLDLGEKDMRKNSSVAHNVAQITKLMDRSRGKIMTYQFLTAFPQMLSRITHSNRDIQDILVKLVYRVIRDYPAQALWPTIGAMQSRRKDRREITEIVLKKAVSGNNVDLQQRINDARRLSTVLLKLAEDKPENSKVREASIEAKYPYVKAAFPSSMIMPLQDALTAVLPSQGSSLRTHMPFPDAAVTIIDISDKVEIMPSLQMPKKLVFKGSDGLRYPFLCKPHDDLRKDARLMDFNSMINKFLKSGSEARRRHLYIRTYAVMPLNEECGLIEWVANTNALKSILEKGYERHKKRIYTSEVYNALDRARKSDNLAVNLPKAFREQVLPMYNPTVFHEWFLNNWPEPTAWLTARSNYARTLAVMSMIGYVLGLGDRHGENILFDGLTGDTVHVDLNCLFDKAKTFDVPERVPFRLTHNMVDALGVTGVDGQYRKAAEITMDILRSNGDSLMSVLEAFVHDPLVEWTKSSRAKTEKEVRQSADRNLKPIHKKLRGVMGETEITVPNQVEALIKQATSIYNLALMYVGWAAWL